jgi:hypothetical protein
MGAVVAMRHNPVIKIIFIRVDSLPRKTFGLEIILGRGLIMQIKLFHLFDFILLPSRVRISLNSSSLLMARQNDRDNHTVTAV